MALIGSTPAQDTHLRHTARIALRESLSDAGFAALDDAKLNAFQSRVVADVARHLKSSPAAAFMLTHLEQHENDSEQFRGQLSDIGARLSETDLMRAGRIIQEKFPDSPEVRIQLLLRLIVNRYNHNGALVALARQLVLEWLADPTEPDWQPVTMPGKPVGEHPWSTPGSPPDASSPRLSQFHTQQQD